MKPKEISQHPQSELYACGLVRRNLKAESHVKRCAILLCTPIHITHPSVWLDVAAIRHQSSTLQTKLRCLSLLGIMRWCCCIFIAIRINCSQEKDASTIKISEGEKAQVYKYVLCETLSQASANHFSSVS
jgi:hypothetical protein